jgi:hypothetical protein
VRLLLLAAALVGSGHVRAADQVPADPPGDGQIPVWSTIPYPAVICYPGEHHAFTATIPAEWFPTATVIEDITSSCACVETAPPPAGTVHPPATALNIPMRIDAGDARARGRLDVWVVGTRAGQLGALRIDMQAEFCDYFTWPSPDPVWRAGITEAGTTPEQTWVMGRGAHPAPWDRLTVEVQGDPNLVTATIAPGADGTWVTTTRWTPGKHLGVIAAVLEWRAWTGQTKLPYHPQRGVRLDVRGSVFSVPALALLGGMRPGDIRSVSVDLAARSGDLPAVLRVETPGEDDIRTELGVAAGGRQELTLTCTAARTAKRYDKAVQVHFVDGTILRIPFLGRVYP